MLPSVVERTNLPGQEHGGTQHSWYILPHAMVQYIDGGGQIVSRLYLLVTYMLGDRILCHEGADATDTWKKYIGWVVVEGNQSTSPR